jgi:hypothetical protein
MKVLNLCCANGHGFEGWFASEDDYLAQNGKGYISCPMCADATIQRLPSAPRLNLSGARDAPAVVSPAGTTGATGATGAAAPETSTSMTVSTAHGMADMHAAWLRSVRNLMANTEDVGPRFADEARRMHYGEKEQRPIRGQASPDERAALADEGIETLAIPVPAALKGPVQ